jgi:hypothetical protein
VITELRDYVQLRRHRPAQKNGGEARTGDAEDEIHDFMAGKGAVTGDIVSPAISSAEWERLGRWQWLPRCDLAGV